MKKHLLLKSGCGLLIGILGTLAPLTATYADNMQVRDYGRDVTTESHYATPSEPLPSTQNYDRTTPQGAQGPMRSDMTMEKSSARKEQDRQRDFLLSDRPTEYPGRSEENDPFFKR